MKKSQLFVALTAIIILANTAKAEDITFKNIPWGIGEEYLLENINNITCHDINDQSQLVAGDRYCYLPYGHSAATIASVKASIMFFFFNNKLGDVNISHIDSSEFDGIASTFKEKYGAICKEHDDIVQNRLGAKFKNVHIACVGGNATINLTKYSDNISSSTIEYQTNDYQKESSARYDKYTTKRLNDL